MFHEVPCDLKHIFQLNMCLINTQRWITIVNKSILFNYACCKIINYLFYSIPYVQKHIFRHFNHVFMSNSSKVMGNSWNGGHLGRHLELRKTLKGDFRGLLVCYSWYGPASFLKNSACYQKCPGSNLFWTQCSWTKYLFTNYIIHPFIYTFHL